MTKAQAEFSGRLCLSKIKPENQKHWNLRVFENAGWHWSLDALGGLFTLYGGCNGERSYSCLLSSGEYTHCGSYDWASQKRFKNPNSAINHQLRMAEDYLTRIAGRVALARTVL
jgi:hypothetical protein